MYTANDIDKLLKDYNTGGASASPAASNQYFTSSDIDRLISSYSPNMRTIGAPRTQLTASQQTYTAPNIVKPVYDGTPTKIVNPIYNGSPVQKVNLPNYNVQELRSGRDFAVVPQAKPNAEKDAYIAEYMKKYPNDPFGKIGAELAYKADSNKALNFAQNLLEAAPILKNITDPINYLDNQAKAKAAAENDALAKMAELEERAKTDPSVLTSKEYFDAASKVSRINYANQALQQAIPDDKNSFKSVGEILNKQSQQATNELLEGKTGLSKFATKAAIGGANLLGDVAMAGALGVKPLDLLSVVGGAQAGQQALDNGESYDRAGLAAVGSGLITRGIESMSGYFGDWGGKAAESLAKTDIGKKVLSKIPQSAANWIAKAADTWLGRKATGALSEGVEEFTEYYAQGFFNNLLLDKDTPLSIKEALYNAGLGTAIGLGAGGSNKAILENVATQPVTRVQDSVQIENPAQPEAAQGNILEPLETEIKAKREREMQAGEALRVSGLVNNEAANKVNRRTRRALDAAAKKLGVKVVFDSTLSGEQGSYDPDNREIHIALDSSDPIGVVMTHEITHRMKETSPEQYEQLKNLAFEIMQENGSYDNVLASVADAYGNDTALIEDEMVAHFTRVMTEDIATFERLAGVDRNLAQKLLDLLDELLRKAGWDNNANVALDSLFGDINPQRLQSVRNSWAQALQNADAGAVGVGNTTQSILLDSQNKYRVVADRDIFVGVPESQKDQVLKDFINKNIRGKDYQSLVDGETIGVAQKNDIVAKLRRPGIAMSPDKYANRQDIVAHYDETIEASKFDRTSTKKGPAQIRSVEIEIPRFDAKNMYIGSDVYDVELLVKEEKGRPIAYDVSKITQNKNASHSVPYRSGNSSLGVDRKAFEQRITQHPDFVKKNPVMKSLPLSTETDKKYFDAVEHEDMQLAQKMVEEAAEQWGAYLNNAEANEVFKQSGKVRTFFHGTNNGDFTRFDNDLLGNSSGDLGWFGKGFYFAFSYDEARSYGNRVIYAYLKMKNPYDYSQLYKYKGSDKGVSEYSRFAWVYNIVKQFPEITKGQKIYAYPNNSENGKAISWEQLANWMDRIEQEAKFSVAQIETPNGDLVWELRANPKQESFTNADGETFTWVEYGMRKLFATEKDAKEPINQVGAYLVEVMGVEPVPRRTIEKIDFSGAVQRAGYDGIVQSPHGDEAVVFDASQIKSADPITYDDNGNIIPLSERFNSETTDIRFSRPLDPNAINRNRDILAPLREGLARATAPHPQPTGTRQGGESAISHIGEDGAFEGVRTLLQSASREHDRRARAERDQVATVATPEDMKPPRVNVQDVAKASYRKLVDSGERVSQIAKATNDKVLYPLFNNAKQARQTAQYNIGVAQTNLSGERIGKSVQDIVGPIKAKGEAYWNAFQDYVYHMHNIDSMTLDTRGAAVLQGFLDELEEANPILAGITVEEAQELRRQPQYREVAGEWINLYNRIQSIHNKPVFGRSVGAEQSREIAGQYLLNHPEFEDLAAEVVGYYRNIINNNVDAGLISAKERDILQQLYPNYVPVMTLRSGVSVNQNDRTARVADVHKRREGNSDLLMPIDEVMARRALSSVAAQRRNLFGVRLLEQALVNRAMVGRDVQSVEDTNIPYDMDVEEIPDLPNGFRVWVDGKPEVMAVSNELMEAVNSIMPKQSDGNLMERFLGKANNAFKKAVTSHNPFFAITNTIKDLQDATFYTEQNLARFFANYGRAYREMLTNGEMWQLYQAMGGTGNSYFNYGEGVNLPAERNGIRGAASTIRDRVEAINLITEQAPRLSEFISVIEKGGRSYENIQKALLAAADITTNFGRSGELGQKINRSYVPFFNPGVQGADKLRRHIQNNLTNKQWASLIGRATLVGILPSLLNYLMWKDDEEYNLLPDHVKDNYYVFKGNDGIWYRIPKGRATMPIGNAAQRAGRAIQGEEGAFEGYLKSSLDAVAPNNPLTDNLGAPIIQAVNNKAWHGGTIEPQRLQKLEEGQRYDEKTDKLSKLIGGATNTSPKKINYVLDQYSGVYGDVLLPLMTPQAEGVALVNRFYTDTVTSNRLANDFYNSLEKSEQAFNTNYNPIDKAEYNALNKAAKTLSEYYAKDREINASDMKGSEKRNQSRELAKERNDFLLKALEEAQAARDTAGKTFSGISDADYALAYIAQKEFTKSKDKKAAVDKAVPHLSMAQKQTLYQAFNIAKSAW